MVEFRFLSLKFCFNLSPSAAGGEARSADQAAWEARTCWHQPGPAGGQRLRQNSHDERHHSESKRNQTHLLVLSGSRAGSELWR